MPTSWRGDPPRRIEFTAQNRPPFEEVKLGSKARWGGRCAMLVRSGRGVQAFVVSPGQERTLKRGGRINITAEMIKKASVLDTPCLRPDGSLRGKR